MALASILLNFADGHMVDA